MDWESWWRKRRTVLRTRDGQDRRHLGEGCGLRRGAEEDDHEAPR